MREQARDPELKQACDQLRKACVKGQKVTLSDGRVLTYKGGEFETVEVQYPGPCAAAKRST